MKQELETVEVGKVKLDVWFKYSRDFGFEIESIEDLTGTQDLTNIISEHYIDKIHDKLTELYRSRGWL